MIRKKFARKIESGSELRTLNQFDSLPTEKKLTSIIFAHYKDSELQQFSKKSRVEWILLKRRGRRSKKTPRKETYLNIQTLPSEPCRYVNCTHYRLMQIFDWARHPRSTPLIFPKLFSPWVKWVLVNL